MYTVVSSYICADSMVIKLRERSQATYSSDIWAIVQCSLLLPVNRDILFMITEYVGLSEPPSNVSSDIARR